MHFLLAFETRFSDFCEEMQSQTAESSMTGLTGALLEEAQMQSHGQNHERAHETGQSSGVFACGAVPRKNGLGVLRSPVQRQDHGAGTPGWNWKLLGETRNITKHTISHNAVIVCFSTSPTFQKYSCASAIIYLLSFSPQSC